MLKLFPSPDPIRVGRTVDYPCRRLTWRVRCIILLAVCGLWQIAGTTDLWAASGKEFVGRDQDVILDVDSRWPGNAYGGYYPLRIRLSNMGAGQRALTLVFSGTVSGRGNELPTVKRTVVVDQQATVNFTLSIPMVSAGTEGILRVYDSNGAELKGLGSRQSLPQPGGNDSRTSLLVISTDVLDEKALEPFEQAATSEAAYISGTVGSGGAMSSRGAFGGYYAQIADTDHVVIQPRRNLPTSWLDYSGVDLIAVAWSDWNSKLSGNERDALLKWTAAGGILTIYGTGKPASGLAELHKQLQLEGAAATAWTPGPIEQFRATHIVTPNDLRSGSVTITTPPVGTGSNEDDESAVKVPDEWKISADTFSSRDWSLGRIFVFPANPFPGTSNCWAWWLSSVPRDHSRWPAKMGMNARDNTPDFLNFMIPGVGTVPVYAFLTLITLFTVVIGPLNYYWLRKQRRLAAMVLTVPVIAGVTCLLLFTWSLIADGFSVRSRVHSFTWIDQHRKTAVALSRLCLYAPFAPSSGMKFSPECAVFPLWQHQLQFDSGTVDLSGNDQRLTSGWLHSQTWTQFQTVETRDERGRLDFTPPSDPGAATLDVSNGLSWNLDYLAVRVSDSQWYAGTNVPAGATAKLLKKQPDEIGTFFQNAMDARAWKMPDGVTGPKPTLPVMYARARRGIPFSGMGTSQPVLTNGLLGRSCRDAANPATSPTVELLDWRDGRNANRADLHWAAQQPHYWAISRENPGIQTGVKAIENPLSLHLLFGTF